MRRGEELTTIVNLIHIYKRYSNSEKYAKNEFNLKIKDNKFIVFTDPWGYSESQPSE